MQMRNTTRLALTTFSLALVLAGCGEEKRPAPAPAAGGDTAAAPAAAPVLEEGPDVGQAIPQYKNNVRRPDAVSAKVEPFDTKAQSKPTLYIMNSTDCPYCTAYIDRMKAIEKTYMAKGVDVVHVYPMQAQSAAQKIEHHTKQGFQGGLIDDTVSEFAKILDVEKTPTAILTDAKGTIVYRGRIDDNAKADRVKVNELADALDLTLAGKPVEVSTTEPFG